MIALRWMALFDSHGDMIDPSAARVAFDFADHFKPDLRIGGGDHFNFRWLRRGASDEEKRDGVLADLEAGIDFLKRWSPDVRLLGNHCWRLNRTIEDANSSGDAVALARMIADRIADGLPEHEVVTYCKRRGVYRLGDHSFVHGYSASKSMTRQHADVYGNVILGHGHTVEIQTSGRADRATGYQAGCLCRLDHEYNRSHMGTLRHRHGFAYGVVTKGGKCVVWLAREEDDGTWILPSEFHSLSSTPNSLRQSSGLPEGTEPDPKEPSPPTSSEKRQGSESANPTGCCNSGSRRENCGPSGDGQPTC